MEKRYNGMIFWQTSSNWLKRYEDDKEVSSILKQIATIKFNNLCDIQNLNLPLKNQIELKAILKNQQFYISDIFSYSNYASLFFKNDFKSGIIKPRLLVQKDNVYSIMQEANSLFESFIALNEEDKYTLLMDCYLFVKIYQLHLFYSKNFEMFIILMSDVLNRHKMLSILPRLIKNFERLKNNPLLQPSTHNIFFVGFNKYEDDKMNIKLIKFINELLKE